MHNPLEFLSMVAASAVKFALTPLASYKLGFTFIQSVLINSVGGCLGVLFFYRISGWLMKRARLRRIHRAIAEKHGLIAPRKRSFTKRNRWIVHLKSVSGLRGLAALTPLLISIPIGSILAAKYFQHDRRTLPTMLSAVVIWAVVLSAFWNVVYVSVGNIAH